MKEVLDIIKKYKLLPQRVYLMPEGIEEEQVINRSTKLAEACLEYGFKLSPRLQIILWGNKRAV